MHFSYRLLIVFIGTNSALDKKALVLGLDLLNLFMQRDKTSQFFHDISMCCSVPIYRQPLHILELPINIITENLSFTMLGFYSLMHRQYSVSMCAETFLIHEFQ